MSAGPRGGSLKRQVGFYGLLFLSLGSIIGSGWLLGALNAAEKAGPASILSWLLAALMLASLAVVYSELGATYPVAGGGARFPYYSHGPIAGFTAGWAAWLQAVFIAPIEALACITYINSVTWVQDHFNMLEGGLLNGTGMLVALALMVLFTAVNLMGAKFMSESNTIVMIWKTGVPFLAVAVIAFMRFDTNNFSTGGGFMPNGWHGVFAALTGGVVFGLQGFEQAVQLAGEAKDPKRDLAKAVLVAMLIGAVLYTLLQVVLIGAVLPADVATGWAKPLGTMPSAYGAWYTLALAVGAGWLAKALLIDAVISPAGTGIVYVGTTSRLMYALGEEREMPSTLSKTNAKGVPVTSILIGSAIGCLAFGPFKSWNQLVGVVTGATAIMYGMAPVALATLRKLDPDRPRTYQVPLPGFMLPLAFCSANLIIYWGGFETTWKLAIAMVVGFVLFAIGALRAGTNALSTGRSAAWLVPWLAGQVGLGALGRYGGYEVLPAWVDILAVLAFSIAMFFVAVSTAMSKEAIAAAIEKDAHQIETTAA